MAYIPALDRLIKSFAKFPGIGYKTAVRLAFHILSMSTEDVKEFADAMTSAKENIKYCPSCQNISEGGLCPICADASRDKGTICVVEDEKAVIAIEKVKEYRGAYHVLHGVISPMEGIGAEDLKIKELITRVANDGVKEVIIATNPNVEGEATAMYISRLLKPFDVKVTRLAYGIPVGAELEYADEVTLYRALEGRHEL